MAKKINIIANLIDKQFKKQMADLQKGKYKINVDVNGEKVNSANKSMKKLNNTAASTNSTFGKLKNTISNTFSSGKIAMTGYLMVLNEINKAGKNAKQTIVELDKAVTDLSVATNMSRESVSGLLQDYNKMAKDMKVTTLSVSQAADDYLRAGKSMSESQQLIKDSVMLSKLGQIDSSAATEDLLATMNGFNMSVDEVGQALDAMVAVDLEAATSAGDIATALKYCASSADVAGVSFSKLVGMIGSVQDKTQQSAETIGTFMNTLLSRYRDVKIGNYVSDDGEDLSDYESVLKSVNISLRDSENEFRSYEDVLQDMADKWDSLSSVEQAALAKTASGVRQQNRFYALMEGYNNVLNLTETAAESAGTAIEKYNKSYENSLEAKQNALQASFESIIMNSDFDEVYGGIIDATTALVDFINETNALKSVMGGLAVGLGVKAFISIKSGIQEAYITLNKFQNALNIVGKTKISTKEYDRLLLLSNGLSKSQMKLVLSTNNLSVAQKKELLMASGLSEEEATLQLQTWKMTSANTGLTASTTTATNAFRGLWTTIKANPLGLIITGVTIGISAWQKYKQSVEETVSSANEAANAYSETASSIDDYVAKYQDLREQLIAAKNNEQETYNIKQQLLELQTELNEQFGEEYGKLNLVTDAYKDQTEAIKAYNEEAGQKYLNENRKGITEATKKMEKNDTYYAGYNIGLTNTDNVKYKDEIEKAISDNGGRIVDGRIEFVGTAEEASESLNNFMNKVRELQAEAEQASDDVSADMLELFDSILNYSGNALADADSIIDEYVEIYNQAKLAEIASDNKLSSGYSELTNAVTAYNDAVANSDDPYNDENVQNAYNNLQTVKQGIDDNEKEWGKYSDVVQKAYNEADTSAYSFYESIKNNTDGVGDLSNELKGLSDIDLQAMADDDTEDSFDKLCNSAKEYGLEVQDVINLLVRLGIVQGEISNDIPDTTSTYEPFDIDSFKDTINSIESGYQSLLDAKQEYEDNGGFLSPSTITDLTESGLIQYLEASANGINFNTDAYLSNTEAAKENAIQQLYNAMCHDVEAIAIGNTSEVSAIAQTAMANAGATAVSAGQQASSASVGWYEYGASLEFVKNAMSDDVQGAAGTTKDQINATIKAYQNIARTVSGINVGKSTKSKSSGSGSSAAKSAEKTMEDIQKEWKEYLDKYLDLYKAELDAGLIDFNTFINKSRSLLDQFYREGKISAKDYWDSVGDLYEEQLDIYDQVLSAVTRRIDKEIDGINDIIDGLEKQNDLLQKQLDDYDGILSVVDDVYEAEINRIKEQQDAIDDTISKLQEENDENQRAIELEKARYQLYKSLNNRNVKLYNGKEFIYTTNRDEVREAQENLAELELEQTIDGLEKERDALDSTVEELEKYRDIWADISSEKEREENKSLAISLFGKDYEQIILSNRIEDIENFKDNYISIQAQIDDNQSTIDSLEEKKEIYEDLKDQWSDIADVYQNAQEDMYASQLLGAQWESDVLSGRIDTLNSFKDQYTSIQQAIANAALESARAQVEAAQLAQSAQTSSGGSGGGSSVPATTTTTAPTDPHPDKYWVYKTLGTYNTNGEASSKIGMLGGDQVIKVGNKYLVVKWKKGYTTNGEASSHISSLGGNGVYKRYFSGTTNATKGWRKVSENEYGDEIIIDNDKNAFVAKGEQLHYFEGGETVIKASESKELLSNMNNLVPVDTLNLPGINGEIVSFSQEELWQRLKEFAPNYSNMMPNVQIPKYDSIPVNRDNSVSVSIGDIHLHEVQKVDTLASDIIRELPNKVIQRLGK